MNDATNDLKRAAAESAAAQAQDGMIVGLGSGTTAALAVDVLGRRVAQGLRIKGIPTSDATERQARALGIPLTGFAEHAQLDITIDGADEVQVSNLNLIKGHGGALLREKIVASATRRFVVVVDESKLVERLGTHFAVPVEVVPFGWELTAARLAELGAKAALRMGHANGPEGRQAYRTDAGNYILDCEFGPIESPDGLAREMDHVVGLVEHGLFLGMATEVHVAGADGVRVLRKDA